MVDILKHPVVTEKMTKQGEALNRYAFVVDRNANKLEIKEAVESMYSVVVSAVNTMNMPAKAKSRFTKKGVTKGRTNAFKKAVITLAEGETIDFYSNV